MSCACIIFICVSISAFLNIIFGKKTYFFLRLFSYRVIITSHISISLFLSLALSFSILQPKLMKNGERERETYRLTFIYNNRWARKFSIDSEEKFVDPIHRQCLLKFYNKFQDRVLRHRVWNFWQKLILYEPRTWENIRLKSKSWLFTVII